MGLLRLLFALTIVIFHTGDIFGYRIFNSRLAILSFFVISGFYMAFILDRKYFKKKHSFKLFIVNRFLKIYPIYWVSLLIIVLFGVVKYLFNAGGQDNFISHFFQYSTHINGLAMLLYSVNFITRNITLVVNSDYFFKPDMTPGYLLVQQAWTLQIELLFYVLAPFLMFFSKKHFLLLCSLYLVLAHIVLANFISKNQIFLSAQFVYYLVFFLMGMSSYRFLFGFLEKNKAKQQIFKTIFGAAVIIILIYNYTPLSMLSVTPVFELVFSFIFALFVPIIFSVTKNFKFDRFLGELSYPLYIIHFIIVKMFVNFTLVDTNLKKLMIVTISLVISYSLYKFIEFPIDKFRQKRVASSSK